MSSIAYLTAGGVCERFPDAKFIFLEANGGWLVPWLERLDHHCRKFQWEVEDLSMLPSEYMKRQCWISFDPDEAMLAMTASHRSSAPSASSGRATTRTPTRSSPASPRSSPKRSRASTFEQKQADHQRERARAVRHRVAPIPAPTFAALGRMPGRDKWRRSRALGPRT